MRHQAKVQACLLAVLVLVTACGQAVGGSARRGSQAVDPGFFFAGPVAAFGRTLSPADTATLSYLRALRRIDVCGLVNRDTVGKVGEIDWYGTLFAFDECDAAVKVPGRTAQEYLSVEVAWERPTGQPAFTAAGLPVHETSPGSCEFLLPLGLAALPGAPPLTSDNQPVVKTSVIGGGDCPLARRATTALAEWLGGRPPPPRDAVAAYPVRLAEQDPCAVLAVVGGEITRWDIERGTPYQCVVDVKRGAPADVGPGVAGAQGRQHGHRRPRAPRHRRGPGLRGSGVLLGGVHRGPADATPAGRRRLRGPARHRDRAHGHRRQRRRGLRHRRADTAGCIAGRGRSAGSADGDGDARRRSRPPRTSPITGVWGRRPRLAGAGRRAGQELPDPGLDGLRTTAQPTVDGLLNGTTHHFYDSWIVNNNVGSTGPNLSVESGPLRIIANHLNGSPTHNIELRGNKNLTIVGNICEGSRREAIIYTMPPWLDSDAPHVQIVGNNITNGGKGSRDTFPAIGIYGRDERHRVRGFNITGNLFACEDHDAGWSHAVAAEHVDDLSICGNQWEDRGFAQTAVRGGGRNRKAGAKPERPPRAYEPPP